MSDLVFHRGWKWLAYIVVACIFLLSFLIQLCLISKCSEAPNEEKSGDNI